MPPSGERREERGGKCFENAHDENTKRGASIKDVRIDVGGGSVKEYQKFASKQNTVCISWLQGLQERFLVMFLRLVGYTTAASSPAKLNLQMELTLTLSSKPCD